MSQQRIKRQHVVSAFYLRGFAENGTRLSRTALDTGLTHAVAVSDATVIKDFYSLPGPDGELSDHFERMFGEIEGLAAAALKAVLTHAALPPGEQREALAVWIALQYLRSEGIRNQGVEHDAQMIRLVVGASGKQALRAHIEAHEGAEISAARLEAEWADITKPSGPTLRADPRDHIKILLELLPGTAALIHDSQWMVLKFQRRKLVTSDPPVSLLPDETLPAWYGVGLATAAGFVLPLDRETGLIVFSGQFGEDAYGPGSTKMHKVLVGQTMGNARKAIYHHPADDPRAFFGGLPDLRESEMAPVGDGLIKEEGFFAGIKPDQKLPSMPHDDEKDGFSLADLTWPIPRRVFEWVEPG